MADNVAVVESAYSAFARGDIAAIVDLVGDSVRWSSPGTLPQGGEFTGKDGVMRFFERVGASWERLELSVEAIGEVADGTVVGVVHLTGALRSGGPSGYGAAHVFTVEQGKVSSFREFVDAGKPLAG